MSTLSVAARYAKSLLQQALEKDMLTNTHASILLFDKVCAANKPLLKVLKSPIINHDKKLAILQGVFKGKVHDLVLNFFEVISQRRREALLPDIAQAFLKQYNSFKGMQAAHVTTAFQLTDDLADRFKALVKTIVPCQEVVLSQHINPAMLGGYILQVEDKQLDKCLTTQLHTLKKNCVASGY